MKKRRKKHCPSLRLLSLFLPLFLLIRTETLGKYIPIFTGPAAVNIISHLKTDFIERLTSCLRNKCFYFIHVDLSSNPHPTLFCGSTRVRTADPLLVRQM